MERDYVGPQDAKRNGLSEINTKTGKAGSVDASDLRPISYGFDRTRTNLHDLQFLSLMYLASRALPFRGAGGLGKEQISTHKFVEKVLLSYAKYRT